MAMKAFAHNYFHPLITAFSPSPIPFSLRWRLLFLFPINILTNLVIQAPLFFRRKPYEEIYIPTRSGVRRALLYRPPSPPSPSSSPPPLHPLHISLHPGAFIGGIPESQQRLDTLISSRLNTVVIAPTYRIAPLHPYPAAIDDIDDIISWLHLHAADAFHADPNLLTTGGTSAGANLALAACMGEGCSGGGEAATRIKGTFTCYAPIELRVPPWEKKILCPDKFPKRDPLRPLMRLYDCYARLSGGREGEARCSPMVMEVGHLPRDVLMVLAEVDVVVDEVRRFVERVRGEVERMGETGGRKRTVELMEVEGAFHGWLELPKAILEEERVRVYERILGFLKGVHRRYGYDYGC